MKKIEIYFVTLVMACICMIFCGCNLNDNSEKKSKQYYLGDTQSYNGISYTINEINSTSYYYGLFGNVTAEDGKLFINVNLTVNNAGKEAISFTGNNFRLVVSESGAEIEPCDYISNETILGLDLQPYDTATRVIRFEVAEIVSTKNLILRYTYTDYSGYLWEDIILEWNLSEKQ